MVEVYAFDAYGGKNIEKLRICMSETGRMNLFVSQQISIFHNEF